VISKSNLKDKDHQVNRDVEEDYDENTVEDSIDSDLQKSDSMSNSGYVSSPNNSSFPTAKGMTKSVQNGPKRNDLEASIGTEGAYGEESYSRDQDFDASRISTMSGVAPADRSKVQRKMERSMSTIGDKGEDAEEEDGIFINMFVSIYVWILSYEYICVYIYVYIHMYIYICIYI
jgi:hypothetical protein